MTLDFLHMTPKAEATKDEQVNLTSSQQKLQCIKEHPYRSEDTQGTGEHNFKSRIHQGLVSRMKNYSSPQREANEPIPEQTERERPFSRKTHRWPSAQAQMLEVSDPQGNANPSHKETPSHLSEWLLGSKASKGKMQGGCAEVRTSTHGWPKCEPVRPRWNTVC